MASFADVPGAAEYSLLCSAGAFPVSRLSALMSGYISELGGTVFAFVLLCRGTEEVLYQVCTKVVMEWRS